MKEHITIGKKAFIRPVVFLEGHVCTAEQAEQLNKDLIGVLRTNLASKDALTQADVDNYAANYKFGTRRSRSDDHVTEVKKMARTVAKGKKTPKELLKTVDKMLKDPKIIEMAMRRVKEIRELSESYLRSDG